MFKRNWISPQYLRSEQINVSILKVIDPANFIVKECISESTSIEAIKYVEVEEAMQNFYRCVEPSFFQIPLKDSIVVVQVEDKYFRGQVRSILNSASGYIFKVYLVDYGKECSVNRSCLYEINPDFQMHPFQAVEFKLYDIEPFGLIMNVLDMTFTYGSVENWDPSATSYLDKLIKAMDSVHIVVKGVEDNCLVGSLFITFSGGEIKCLNTDLVENKFARVKVSNTDKNIDLESYLKNPVSTLNVKAITASLTGNEKCIHYLSTTEGTKIQSIKSLNKECSPPSEKLSSSSLESNSNASNKSCDMSDNKPNGVIKRKMNRCIAVDVNRISKEKENECSTTLVASPMCKLLQMMKSHQIKAAELNSEDKKESTSKESVVTSSGNSISPSREKTEKSLEILEKIRPKKLSSPNGINKDSEMQPEIKSGESEMRTRKEYFESKMEIPKNETQSNDSNILCKKKSPVKVNTIKQFLMSSQKLVSTTPNKLSESECTVNRDEKAGNNHLLAESTQENDSKISNLEELIKEVTSDNDPDDLLQNAMDPDKNNSFSKNEISRYVKR